MNKFKLIQKDKWVGGVCSGLAYYLGIQTWIVRLVTFILVFGYGFSIWCYLLVWMFAPKWENDPSDYKETCE